MWRFSKKNMLTVSSTLLKFIRFDGFGSIPATPLKNSTKTNAYSAGANLKPKLGLNIENNA